MAANAYAAAVLADNPRLYWKLQDASGNAADASGNGRPANGTSGSITYQVPGMTVMGDFAQQFAASAVQTQTPHQMGSFTDNFSVEMIIRLVTSPAGDKALFTYGNTNFDGFWLMMNSSNKIFVIAQNRFALGAMSNAITSAAFAHVVFSRRSGTWVYHYNGTTDTANAGTNSFSAGATDTVLGLGASGSAPFSLEIAHFAVYTAAALTDARIQAHWNAANEGAIVPGQYVTKVGGKGAA